MIKKKDIILLKRSTRVELLRDMIVDDLDEIVNKKEMSVKYMAFKKNGLNIYIWLTYRVKNEKLDLAIEIGVEKDIVYSYTIFKQQELTLNIGEYSSDILCYIDLLSNVDNRCIICFNEKKIDQYCYSCFFKRCTPKNTLCCICSQNISCLYQIMPCCQKEIHVECLNFIKNKKIYTCPECKENSIYLLTYSPNSKSFIL